MTRFKNHKELYVVDTYNAVRKEEQNVEVKERRIDVKLLKPKDKE